MLGASGEAQPGLGPAALHRSNWGIFNRCNWGVFVRRRHRPHPEQGYRACLGLKRLARQYSPARLEAACTRALAIRSPTFRSVDSILKCGLDRQHSLLPATTPALPQHENVRGPDYYH